MINYKENYNKWLEDNFFDEETREELSNLIDEKEIEDRFYRDLEFGTGGLRGVMGAGTNRMNKYTIGKATKGLGTYLLDHYGVEVCAKKGVVIGYDTRNNSKDFSEITANVLTGMGIKVFLHSEARPTPQLSFSVKFLNTLSENGAVTRGICETNEEGYLTAVHETSNIVKTPEGAAVDNDGQLTSIDAESYASMNMWGLTPEFMQTLEEGFKEFFANMGNKDILKAEYLLPIYIDELLQAGRVSVKVLDTNDKWFGVTYKEDKDYVVKSFARLIEAGVYQRDLFEDLK